MTMHEQLMEKFAVRRTNEEKQRFRQWVTAQMKQAGWEARTETTSKGKHENVVIGDPEHAAVIFTAHYDTPADMLVPNMLIPRNIPMYVLYQAAVIAVLLALGLLASAAVGALTHQPKMGAMAFFAVYFGVLVFISYGRSNRTNANDNTSGVAAALQLALSLPEELRGKAAFILFDNEEKGKQGSKAYAKDHLQQQYMTLVINMDCVGDGEHMLIISKDMARKCTGFGTLQRLMTPDHGIEPHFYDSKLSVCNSDQSSFKCGVAVVACHKAPVVGYVTGRIHTRRDTVCEQRNIDYLAERFAAWLQALEQGV